MMERRTGHQIHDLARSLFPICRSITGDGVRETLRLIGDIVPLQVREVPSGVKAFDWTVPPEWNIRDAYLLDPAGRKVIDFAGSNLHVVSYSVPVHRTVSLAELRQHLHTLPEHPEWIPYRTSYYAEDWGFCMSHRQFQSLQEGQYTAVIDSTLAAGHLTYGECSIPGQSAEEVLISTHVCHPSMANDNLSGVCTAAYVARRLALQTNRYSYRFLFIPGTIGAITWLAQNSAQVGSVRHGLVLTGLGGPGPLTYKKSRRGNAEIDAVAQYVLCSRDPAASVREFSPNGYDERQYCSPGFNLPVGRLSRTPYAEYDEYHTSADDIQFITPAALDDGYEAVLQILATLEQNVTYRNLNPLCEPQLGRRGLYDQHGLDRLALLWVLNLSDGDHSLLDISRRAAIPFGAICDAAATLRKAGLIEETGRTG